MTDVRDQVLARMIKAAVDAGCKDFSAAYRFLTKTFPGVPGTILAGAAVDVADQADEAWWRSVELTIEGETVGRALTVASGSPVRSDLVDQAAREMVKAWRAGFRPPIFQQQVRGLLPPDLTLDEWNAAAEIADQEVLN